MILLFTYTIPTNDPPTTEAALHQGAQQLQQHHKSLLGHTITETDDGVELQMRVSSRDRYSTLRHGREIVTSLCRRAKIDTNTVTMVSYLREATSNSLTKATGRPPANRLKPRGRRTGVYQVQPDGD